MIVERFTGRRADELKRDESALADVLREAGAEVKRRDVRCPFCDDKKPSGSIYANGNGFAYKCHKCRFGGSILDVIAKVDGLDIAAVFKRLKGDTRTKQKSPTTYPDIESLKAAMPYSVDAIYQYVHPDTGKVEMIVIRMVRPDGDKEFRQARSEGTGFIQKAPAKPWPIYNRARIRNADTVVVVEGEGCVHALHEYNIVATTSPAGAGKAHHANWNPLAGKNVILWPDNDEPGRAHMAQGEKILQCLEPAPRIAVLDPACLDLSEKEDAADFIAQLETLHSDKAQIQAAILEGLNTAKPKGIAAGVGEMIEDTIAGRREAVKWPWGRVGGLTKALQPGTVTIICGNVGASKSFILLETSAYWHENGIKAAVFELEEDRDFHLSRCLAQKSGTAGMTDPDWIRDNPEQARAIYAENREWLDDFGRCIFASPDTQPTLEQLAEWTKARAKAGCRIIAVDPITVAAHRTRNVWEEDNAFLHDIKRTATDYRCSVVLVTHPVKTVSFPDVTQLAGGAAYSRFAQTILWLESHPEKTSQVKTDCGTADVLHNRTLHLLKVRNGKGQGMKLAFNFKGESLTLREEGIIVKKSKVGSE
ncbi:MAG: AAA family ATPase [Phycisphaerae bacterium]|nr:AAA family ATPase [Phycisphaerae bacterium]